MSPFRDSRVFILGAVCSVECGYDPEKLWVREYASRGLNIKYLITPFDVATFRNLVAARLNISPDKNHEP